MLRFYTTEEEVGVASKTRFFSFSIVAWSYAFKFKHFSILQLHSNIFVRVCASHRHARIEEIKELLVQSTVSKKMALSLAVLKVTSPRNCNSK